MKDFKPTGNDATGFDFGERVILRDPRISSSAKVLYMCINGFSRSQLGCIVSNGRFATYLGCTSRHIPNLLNELKMHGIISIEPFNGITRRKIVVLRTETGECKIRSKEAHEPQFMPPMNCGTPPRELEFIQVIEEGIENKNILPKAKKESPGPLDTAAPIQLHPNEIGQLIKKGFQKHEIDAAGWLVPHVMKLIANFDGNKGSRVDVFAACMLAKLGDHDFEKNIDSIVEGALFARRCWKLSNRDEKYFPALPKWIEKNHYWGWYKFRDNRDRALEVAIKKAQDILKEAQSASRDYYLRPVIENMQKILKNDFHPNYLPQLADEIRDRIPQVAPLKLSGGNHAQVNASQNI